MSNINTKIPNDFKAIMEQYDIKELIGSGDQGPVYKAVQKKTG